MEPHREPYETMNKISKELSEWIAARSRQRIRATLAVDDKQIASGHAVFLKEETVVLFYQEQGFELLGKRYPEASLKVSGRNLNIQVFGVHQCSASPPHIHCDLVHQ